MERPKARLSADFLCELVNLAKDNMYPIIIGGDFICLDSNTKRVRAIFIVIGLSCLMLSSIA
jgi:hypothetical protein